MKTEKETLAHMARRASRLSSKLIQLALRLTPDGKGTAAGPTTWYTASKYATILYEAGKAMGEAEGYLHALQVRNRLFSNTSHEETQ